MSDHAWMRGPLRRPGRIVFAVLLAVQAVALAAQSGSTPPPPSIAYRLSFPDRAHRLLDVADGIDLGRAETLWLSQAGGESRRTRLSTRLVQAYRRSHRRSA